MVPKLIKGGSFKGAAAYLLHDKNAATSARVLWTETRNLATSDPESAWRIMAATAMDADRLKAQAGIKATGRKATQSVLHLVLSWHPDEAESLDRDQMLAAAESAVAALGGGDRQAIILAHNDCEHPHVHVLLNRHSPLDGRILSSSKEKLKLSKWAEDYERERGQIYCEERVLNNEARDRGDYTRAEKETSRPIVEAEKLSREAANDNPDKAARLRTDITARARDLGKRSRTIAERHKQEWLTCEATHKTRRAEIRTKAQQEARRTRSRIAQEFRPAWRELHTLEKSEQASFEANESSRLGRMRNLIRAVDPTRSALDGDPLRAVSRLWSGMFSGAKRAEFLTAQQAERRRRLEAEQRKALKEATQAIRAERKRAFSQSALTYHAERSFLAWAQSGERAKLRTEWYQLGRDRRAAYAKLKVSHENKLEFARKASDRGYFAKMKDRAQAKRDAAPEQNNTRGQERE
jgi:hypothetical protein